jgi:hypothetical protein
MERYPIIAGTPPGILRKNLEKEKKMGYTGHAPQCPVHNPRV